ncbi:MAG: sigma-70 family RNA polymerase sigma factor [Acidobacteria bacterium]|nr:sigma-70 family RNA polymerase sigma factor [Acidobacteriota bacterium]
MAMEDDAKEVTVPVNATHLRAIPGSKPDSAPGSMTELESLFRQHHDRVFRTAYRITGSIVDAEDVLQTVFLRLSRRGGDVNLEPNPASYLHRAAINASLDLMRQRGRTESIHIDDIVPSLMANPKLNPESLRANRELRVVIRRAISKLGEKSAEMFVLKYFEGYENKEIAEMMGTSAMVVGVLLHRARARVKKDVGDFLETGRG